MLDLKYMNSVKLGNKAGACIYMSIYGLFLIES